MRMSPNSYFLSPRYHGLASHATVEPDSVVGLIVGMHADFGELIHFDRIHRELYEASISFFKWIYVPPAGTQLYGALELIPVPRFNSPTWPFPDILTSEAFRAKMRKDFQMALKPNTGSCRSHLQWFMSLTIFVDLFASAATCTRTPTLYTIKNINDLVFSDLIDLGWNHNVTNNGDIIRCTMAYPSMIFHFHIVRQTLYVNFFFTQEKTIGTGWVLMEQESSTPLVQLKCFMPNANLPSRLTFNVGTAWPVAHLGHEVQISVGNYAPVEFTFSYDEPTKTGRKINWRKEKSMTVVDVLPLKVLKINCSSML